MEKRALIAIVLSFVVFFGYTKVIAVLYPEHGKKEIAVTSQQASQLPGSDEKPTLLPTRPATHQIDKSSGEPDDQRATIALPLVALEYSENRATVTNIHFTQYPDDKGGPYSFIKAASGKTGVGAMDVLLVDGDEVGGLDYTTAREPRQIRSSADGDKINVQKTWNFSDDVYGQGLTVAVTNTSAAPVRFRYRILTGSGIVTHNSIDSQYIEANWLTADKLHHIHKPNLDKPKSLSDTAIAASIKNRHFSSILKPIKTSGTFSMHVEAYDKQDFGSYLVRSETTISPGETLTDSFLWYAGPNRMEELQPYELDRLVNFGKLDFIAKIVLGGLHMVAGVVKNYGVAIILLTIITNIIFMPLTKTSFMSMRRMQLVQPEMVRLREKYKGNPAKLNTEMTELYKKHKVNPMGGCLPMLLQMPIFIRPAG